MEKKFRDLKKGDSVWIVDRGEVVEAKVKETRESYVYTSFHGWPYCGWPGSKRAGNMFVNEEDAFRQLEKISGARMKILEKKIDSLVTEFDLLDSIQAPTEFSSTKPPSMKELKPGDSVWYVDKEELTVEKAKVKRLGENRGMYGYGSLRIETDKIPFTTHPNSTQSTSYTFYTGEEQAWKYMLGWKKSRMRTVGKEMEKLMKEYEEIWRPEGRG